MSDYATAAQELQAQLRPLRLPVTPRDRSGLVWLDDRLAEWVTYVRRRRKRLPPGNLTPDETRVLRLLLAADDAIRALRAELEPNP